MNAGTKLAAMRPMTEKPCEKCGSLFIGLARKKVCNRCMNKARVERFNLKRKQGK